MVRKESYSGEDSLNSFKRRQESLSSSEIEKTLSILEKQMSDFENNGNYAKADKCKEKIGILRLQLSDVKLKELINRHAGELISMENAKCEQVKHFNLFWEDKEEKLRVEADRLRRELENKHLAENTEIRNQLEVEYSYRFKESSECLNKRRIQSELVKQKKFAEAEVLKKQIEVLERKEKKQYEKQRSMKIDKGVQGLKVKQKGEITTMLKRTKTAIAEQSKERNCQFDRLVLKYKNLMKQLKSQQQREILAQKGQLRSKTGQTMRSSSKSKLTKMSSVEKK